MANTACKICTLDNDHLDLQVVTQMSPMHASKADTAASERSGYTQIHKYTDALSNAHFIPLHSHTCTMIQ